MNAESSPEGQQPEGGDAATERRDARPGSIETEKQGGSPERSSLPFPSSCLQSAALNNTDSVSPGDALCDKPVINMADVLANRAFFVTAESPAPGRETFPGTPFLMNPLPPTHEP
ncbi:unnamed protein product [Arctogadus glacialis]